MAKNGEGLERETPPQLMLERISFISVLVNQGDCRRVGSTHRGQVGSTSLLDWTIFLVTIKCESIYHKRRAKNDSDTQLWKCWLSKMKKSLNTIDK